MHMLLMANVWYTLRACMHSYTLSRPKFADFVDDMFKLLAQQLVYSGIFHGIEAHDMPKLMTMRVVLGLQCVYINETN